LPLIQLPKKNVNFQRFLFGPGRNWFKKNSDRSRGDAEKLLAIASAVDADAAAEEAARRNREHQAKHRERTAAYVSGEQLEREARVKSYTEK
jgi:hypothetical protein